MSEKAKTSRPVIGIVGGVCSGKSAVAAELGALGCVVLSGDVLGHEVLAEPQVRELIRRRWGQGVLTPSGEVDRPSLGRIVFGEPEELAVLDTITWPRIRSRLEAGIAEALHRPDVTGVAIDAAVLFEAGWDDLCTHVLFVDAPREVRLERARQRGWDEQTWARREKSQFPLDSKAAQCYASLDSGSSLSHLREQTHQAFHRIVLEVYGS